MAVLRPHHIRAAGDNTVELFNDCQAVRANIWISGHDGRDAPHYPTIRIELHQSARGVVIPAGILECCERITVGKMYKGVWMAVVADTAEFAHEARLPGTM